MGTRGIHVTVSVATLDAFTTAINPATLNAGSCDDLLRAVEAVKGTEPDAFRAWPGIIQFVKAVEVQRDRVRWSRSGHVTGQLDLAGGEVQI